MNILLVNTTPVVSRLLSLCMRGEHITFEEVSDVHVASRDEYDVVFVDEASYMDKMKNKLEQLKAHKRVYLTSDKDEIVNSFFNRKVVKPFLPSQIVEIINGELEESGEGEVSSSENGTIIPTQMSSFIKATEENSSQEELTREVETNSYTAKESQEKQGLVIDDIVTMNQQVVEDDEEIRIFDVNEAPKKDNKLLNKKEIAKIKGLLKENETLDDTEIVTLNEREKEKRKIEVIKEQLKSEGLEIVTERDILNALGSSKDTKVGKKREKKKLKVKKEIPRKEEKKEKVKKIDHIIDEDISLEDICQLKVKKIRKILKGLEIHIRIRFEEKD
jgi:CheY-like chemotaxis protein